MEWLEHMSGYMFGCCFLVNITLFACIIAWNSDQKMRGWVKYKSDLCSSSPWTIPSGLGWQSGGVEGRCVRSEGIRLVGCFSLFLPQYSHVWAKWTFNKEGVEPYEILTRLKAQFVDATMSRTQVLDWHSKFKKEWKMMEMKVIIDAQSQVSQMTTSVQFATLSKVTGGYLVMKSL